MQNTDYEIFTDAGGDYAPEICNKDEFIKLPMEIEMDGEILKVDDILSIDDYDEFYVKMKTGSLPKTSQINQFTFESFFEPVLKDHKDVLYLALSSGISNQYETAKTTANQLNEKYENKVYVVDTLSATMGNSLITKRAIENRHKNLSAKENAKDLDEFKNYVQHWFTVDDLFHLKRGGRISVTKAILGTALSVKPILLVDENGKLDVSQSVRGKKQALKTLVEKFSENVKDVAEDVVITYVSNLESAKLLKKQIQNTNKAKNVYILPTSPIIGTHTGTGAITIGFIGKHRTNMK